ncbi:MAG TPA: hypothetical protein VMZ53_03745 [Kofleriaceae bacterium]|nr:hypothetical protein [Kofleriaceae bacterium]
MAAVGDMNLEQLLVWARAAAVESQSPYRDKEAARAILTLLGVAWPCGLEEPPIVSMGDGTCGVLVDNGGDPLTPDELRGYAARLLQLAEEAEEQSK